jgi:hypothetical protein
MSTGRKVHAKRKEGLEQRSRVEKLEKRGERRKDQERGNKGSRTYDRGEGGEGKGEERGTLFSSPLFLVFAGGMLLTCCEC